MPGNLDAWTLELWKPSEVASSNGVVDGGVSDLTLYKKSKCGGAVVSKNNMGY